MPVGLMARSTKNPFIMFGFCQAKMSSANPLAKRIANRAAARSVVRDRTDAG